MASAVRACKGKDSQTLCIEFDVGMQCGERSARCCTVVRYEKAASDASLFTDDIGIVRADKWPRQLPESLPLSSAYSIATSTDEAAAYHILSATLCNALQLSLHAFPCPCTVAGLQARGSRTQRLTRSGSPVTHARSPTRPDHPLAVILPSKCLRPWTGLPH